MPNEEVEYDPGPGRIPYRAYRTDTIKEDGAIVWQVLYKQDHRVDYWGPHGTFTEKDGKFTAGSHQLQFDSARSALAHVATFG